MRFSSLKPLVALALSLVTTSTLAINDSDNGTPRVLLLDIAASSSIHVKLTPRAGSTLALSGVAVDGELFPRSNADGSLHFDGRLSYVHQGAQYNLTLLNNRGFVTVADTATHQLQRVDCIHPDNIPPLHELSSALRSAQVVDAATSNASFNVSCASQRLVQVTFAGEPFVFCAPSTTETAVKVEVVGDDLNAAVRLFQRSSLDSPSLLSIAPPSPFNLSQCDAIDMTVTPRKRRLTVASRESPDCGCREGRKQCLFVHGLGYTDGEMTDAFPEYFGSVQEQLPCCAQVKFLHIDTLNAAWDDHNVTRKLCDAAVQLSGSADRHAIEGVAIIAHSMGNLVSAAALDDQCGLAASSKWIALAGPMRGSASASSAMTAFAKLPRAVVERLCTDDRTSLDDPLLHALTFFGLCPTRRSLQSIVLQGSRASSRELDARLDRAVASFGRHVSSSLCAVSPAGLASKDSAMLAVLGVASGHASLQNDGQVEFASCRGPLDASLYSTSWRDGAFYKPQINHLDATFRHGDGWWGDDRKPLKWLNCQF
ncbi:hypothetical protein PINS_up013720 [Pythium insidiosum]|nr:hypothetical protein PINS_up013720 [Pythium insidiosum]